MNPLPPDVFNTVQELVNKVHFGGVTSRLPAMARPSVINPLGYVINRPYTGSVEVKNKLLKERLAKARNLYRKDLLAHYGCVNAIEFSEEGELLVSGK